MPKAELSFESLVDSDVRVPETVVHRAFDHETVLLNLETGQYHGLRGSGGRIFELLEQTGSARLTAEMLATECDESPQRILKDVAELCTNLLARGLIEVTTPSR